MTGPTRIFSLNESHKIGTWASRYAELTSDSPFQRHGQDRREAGQCDGQGFRIQEIEGGSAYGRNAS